MPLQFFDDVANETHGDRLKAGGAIAKSFCRGVSPEMHTVAWRRVSRLPFRIHLRR
jgi:hypothetical protein